MSSALVARLRLVNTLPGFGPGLGVTVLWLSLLVLLPLGALAVRPWELGVSGFVASLLQPRVLAALRLSFGTSLLAALINVPIGLVIAWVLARVRPPGWRVLDAVIDLPFALPTAVAGITLTALYAPDGWLGAPLARLGLKIAYAPAGIVVALIFVGLPFIVRTAVPVLRDMPRDVEEAAETLGARPGQIVWRILLPALAPALLTGFGLAFARGVGEYGSVIFIAGNMPMVSEIAPLMIVIRLQQFDYAGAASVGLAMLGFSTACLAVIAWARRRLPASRTG
ncbi:MAG TPA: sulfate ABC transporter permease subunit CysT [Acetobacteraceae bacterium]|nr:sulfate ABC transporter permease subunit CysT [Acetobacteraceae bacterium]